MTAGLLNSFGYELIADDILPVSFDRNSIPGAWPYLRRLKLHRKPIIKLALTPGERVSETLDKEKYFFYPTRAADDKWRRLERLYLLENDVTGSQAPIEQITGAEAVRALVDQTYHFNFILATRRLGDHLAFCAQLASKILIYRLRRSPLNDGSTLGLASARTLKVQDRNPEPFRGEAWTILTRQMPRAASCTVDQI